MSWKPEETAHGKMLNICGKSQAIEAIDARIAQFDRHGIAVRKVQYPIGDNAAGKVVLAGALPRPVAAKAGDALDADYGLRNLFKITFTSKEPHENPRQYL